MRSSRFFIVALLTYFSCALFAGGAGEQGQSSSGTVPAWVSHQPADADGKSYFVATGNSRDGNETQAQDAAAMDLVNQINRYMGVSINAESVATEISTANDIVPGRKRRKGKTVRDQFRRPGKTRHQCKRTDEGWHSIARTDDAGKSAESEACAHCDNESKDHRYTGRPSGKSDSATELSCGDFEKIPE